MTHALPCRRFRQAALEPRFGLATDASAPASASAARDENASKVEPHSASCAECAAWLSRLPRREALLREVPRVLAPDELRGRVVASLHAGERQARAIRALMGLGRLTMPDDVLAQSADGADQSTDELGDEAGHELGSDRARERDELHGVQSNSAESGAIDSSAADSLADREPDVDDPSDDEVEDSGVCGEPGTLEWFPGRREAPSVLDRLVAEELRDPARARASRFVGTLPRLFAPAELAERVADDIRRPAPRSPRVVWWIAAAAALVITAIAPILLPGTQNTSTPERQRPFRVEHVDSFAELSPFARGLLDTASSGMVQRGNS